MALPAEREEEIMAEVKDEMKWRIQSGFWTLRRAIEDATTSIKDLEPDTPTPTARQLARAAVTPLWEDQKKRQQTWPAGTTLISGKIARAFDSLEIDRKILARMNFSCCRTCGMAEIGEDQEEDTVGFVFFHEQGTRSVVEMGGSLCLYYGSFTRSQGKDEEVGKAVVESLQKAGVSVEWDGDPKKAIEIDCGEWRKRV